MRPVPLTTAVLGGLLLSFAFPPGGFWPFALALVGVWYLVATAPRTKDAFGLGFAAACGFFVPHLLWLPQSLAAFSGGMFWVLFPLMIAGLGGMWGAVTWAARAFGGPGRGTLLLLPPLWILLEWLRGLGALAFPWGLLGYVWTDTPVAQLAAVGGVYGLSFLTAVVASLLAEGLLALRTTRKAEPDARPAATLGIRSESGTGIGSAAVPLATAALLAVGAFAAGARLEARPVPDATERALLVQGATDPFGRAVGLESDLDVYLRLTSGALEGTDGPPDVVVWPEGVIMEVANLAGAAGERIRRDVTEAANGAAVITGAATFDRGRDFNSVYSVVDGQAVDRFDKVVLVPFGESAPLAGVLLPVYRTAFGWFGLSFHRGRSPGAEVTPLATPLGPAATYICYESVFPAIPRQMTALGATYLVNISNDAWFGYGPGAEQHFDMGRMRAIENGRYLLRVGNDGITALVDPRGRVVDRLPRGPEGTLDVRFGRIEDVTPYVRFGDLPVLAVALLIPAFVAGSRLIRPAPPP